MASICLVQTALLDPREVDDILRSDRSRKDSIETIRNLLGAEDGEQSLLQQYAQGPTDIVLMPEYAFGSGDWDTVDALVRACRQNLILVAGFGATKGAALLSWLEDAPIDAVTERLMPLRANHGIGKGLTYNGGWCWIHDAVTKRTWCITFLKNYAEQETEVGIIDGFGQETLALAFKDLILFPNICADLLNDPEPPDSHEAARHRIAHALAVIPPSHKALITGSLYQEKPWAPAWQAGLVRLFEGLGDERRRAIVALANRAADVEDSDEQKDQWRSLSGIYTSRINNAVIWQPDAATRAVEHTNFSGGVVRRTDACVVFGRIQWEPYNSRCGKHLWGKCNVAAIRSDGTIEPVKSTPSVAGHELGRFLKRRKPDSEDQRLLEGLAHVRTCLLTCELCIRAELLATTALHGASSLPTFEPDALHRLEANGHDLARALTALSYLTSHSMGMSWQTDTEQKGQLHWHNNKSNVLVWCHKGGKTEVKSAIQEWMRIPGSHPPLLVIADARTGQIQPGPILLDRKVKISDPPDPEADKMDRVSQARSQRCAALYPLSEVLDRCHDPDSGTAEDLLQTLGQLIPKTEPERTAP